MRRFTFLILLGLALGQITAASVDIIDGKRLAKDEIPQVQALYTYTSRGPKSFCTATLIGPRVIITAAHCIVTDDIVYESGRDYIEAFFYVDPHYQHKYDPLKSLAFRHDIAIGILSRKVRNVAPLSVTRDLPQIGERTLYTGVGRPRSGVRQYGYGEVVALSDLGITLRGLFNEDNQRQVTSNGDSGGGHFMLYPEDEIKLIAVNSVSTKKTTGKYPLEKPYSMGEARIFTSDSEESFLEKIVRKKRLKVCGINLDCAPVYFRK